MTENDESIPVEPMPQQPGPDELAAEREDMIGSLLDKLDALDAAQPAAGESSIGV